MNSLHKYKYTPKTYIFIVATMAFALIGAGVYSSVTNNNNSIGNSSAAAQQISVPPPYGAGARVPATGIYLGMSVNGGDTNITPDCTDYTSSKFNFFECKLKWAGAQQGLTVPQDWGIALHHVYTSCTKRIGSDIVSSAAKTGREVMLVSMSCGLWTDLAAGDATLVAGIKARVAELKSLNIPVILVFHHEPENDSCGANGTAVDGSSYHGTPDDYRAAYRKFVQVMRDESILIDAQNISSGWTIMGWTLSRNETVPFPGSCTGLTPSSNEMHNPDYWYPGDDAVDWIVPDIYSNGSRTFSQMIQSIINWTNSCRSSSYVPSVNYSCSSAKFSKPFGLAEYGFDNATTTTFRAQQFDSHVSVLKVNPKLKLLSYWNSDVFVVNGDASYLIDYPASDTNRTVLKSYARVAFDPYVANITYTGGSTPNSADLNSDGKVDVYDLTALTGKWNTTDTTADISKDGIVNVFDLSILLSKWTLT